MQRLLKIGDRERAFAKKNSMSELKKVEKRQRELDTLFVKMYEGRAADKITVRNFSMLSTRYQDVCRLSITVIFMFGSCCLIDTAHSLSILIL